MQNGILALPPTKSALSYLHHPQSLPHLSCWQLQVAQDRNLGKIILDSLVLTSHIHFIRKLLALPLKHTRNSTSFSHLHSYHHLLLGNCNNLLTNFPAFTLFFIVC